MKRQQVDKRKSRLCRNRAALEALILWCSILSARPPPIERAADVPVTRLRGRLGLAFSRSAGHGRCSCPGYRPSALPFGAD